MDFLVLAPPVCTPSEPPSGAFLLAAGLRGRGFDVGIMDLSLEFFHLVLDGAGPVVKNAIGYLLHAARGYEPMRHRSAAGHLHTALSDVDRRFPGWKLTLMDMAPPSRVHHPRALAQLFDEAPSPFERLWQEILAPSLEALLPQRILISLAYLSQLPAAIDLVRFLKSRGIAPVIGGSLPTSLAATGQGLDALAAVFPHITIGDGMALLPGSTRGSMMDHLSWPTIVSDKPYLSARPIIPLALSSGCFWNRCLFCPDRSMPFSVVPDSAIAQLFQSIPHELLARRPVIHLLDSALPPSRLRRFLPYSKAAGTGFFGFARPTAALADNGLLTEAAAGGCLMLQLGVESGSERLLTRFQKGIHPNEARAVIDEAAGAGIRTYLYLLFGLPGETLDDLRATLAFASDAADAIDFLNLSLFNLPRYCELAARSSELGIRFLDFPGHDGQIRLYRPFIADGVDTRQQARDFLKAEFKADPKIKHAQLRTPRWFRAAHLALMQVPRRNATL